MTRDRKPVILIVYEGNFHKVGRRFYYTLWDAKTCYITYSIHSEHLHTSPFGLFDDVRILCEKLDLVVINAGFFDGASPRNVMEKIRPFNDEWMMAAKKVYGLDKNFLQVV